MDSTSENLWYYFDGTSTFGPFSTSTIRQLIASSVIKTHFQLRREGEETWKPFEESDFQSIAQTSEGILPPDEGNEIPAYYLAKDGNSVGPFRSDEIRRQLTAGELCLTDLLWKEGSVEWKSISEFVEFNSAPPRKIPPPLPSRIPPPLPKKLESQTISPRLKWGLIAASITGLFIIFGNLSEQDSGASNGNREMADFNSPGMEWSTSSPSSNSRSTLQGAQPCPRCKGTGNLVLTWRCDRCQAKGTTTTPSGYTIVCSSCGGTGTRPLSCGDCGGTGRLP